MFRIILGDDDLARTRVAPAADMSFELALSLHALMVGAPPHLQYWQRQFRARRNPQTRKLLDLVASTQFPEFLTVRTGRFQTARATADAAEVAATAYIGALRSSRPLSAFAKRIAAADRHARLLLGDLTAEHQATALDPYKPPITNRVLREYRRRTRQQAATGIESVLSSLHPAITWKRPVLSIALRCDHDVDLPLAGQGLLLQPTVFSAGGPAVAGLHGRADQPVLLYPEPSGELLTPRPLPEAAPALTALLGRTRAQILQLLAASGATSTIELSHQLSIAPATASGHATVLANAGLTIKVRHGGTVLHHITALGQGLCDTTTAQGPGPSGEGEEPCFARPRKSMGEGEELHGARLRSTQNSLPSGSASTTQLRPAP